MTDLVQLHPDEGRALVSALRTSARRLGLTERNVSLLVGVSHQTINNWFADRATPLAPSTARTILRVIDHLDGVPKSDMPMLAKRDSRHRWAESAAKAIHGAAG